MKKVFIYSPELDEYPFPESCPFDSTRTGKLERKLQSLSMLNKKDKQIVKPEPATQAEIETYHDPEYIAAIITAGKGIFNPDMLHYGLGTGDCPVFKGMFENFKWSTGSTLTAARILIEDKARIAFAPAGGLHHAHKKKSAGFCYVNDIVLACNELNQAGKRVLFLDIDVHHADGVQEAFYNSDQVFTISLHQDGRSLFPGTGSIHEMGTGKGKGYTVNFPLPAGTYDQAYLKVFHELTMPLIKAYAPDVIVIEIGTDALKVDPLANLELTNNVYAEIIHNLLTFDLPILATGGGGYNIENTIRAWALCWNCLCGDDDFDNHFIAGIGGVMMQSSEWAAGLRDRQLIPDNRQKELVNIVIEDNLKEIKTLIFPTHGLDI